MRLIDADALIERVKEIYPSACDNCSFLEIIVMTPTYTPTTFEPPMRIMTRDELLAADYNNLTSEEKERVKRCRAIPEVVVELCTAERERLRNEVMKLEKAIDTIGDYLNGYDMSESQPFELPF